MKKYIPILGVVLAVGWMMIIFYFSSKTGAEIDNTQSFFVKRIVLWFEGSEFSDYPISRQQAIISRYSYFLSKTAHYFEYGILCYFCFLLFFHLKKYHLRYIMSLLICILYAIGDEYHQVFSSGRTPRVQDVLIDFLGALTAILLIELFLTIRQIIKTGKNYD